MAIVHLLVKAEIKRGTIEPKYACEECGAQDRVIVAHHDDYAKPLDVRWLCRVCHSNWHVRNGPGLNRHLAGFPEPGGEESQYGVHKEEMIILRKDGWTLQKIGDKFGVTREAVRHVVGPSPPRISLAD